MAADLAGAHIYCNIPYQLLLESRARASEKQAAVATIKVALARSEAQAQAVNFSHCSQLHKMVNEQATQLNRSWEEFREILDDTRFCINKLKGDIGPGAE